MKTLRKTSFVVLLALSAATVCSAQTADDIVAKYTQAIGGKDAVASVKSLVTTANVSVMGNDLPMTMTVLVGKGYKRETDYNGAKIIQCITDHGGWGVNPAAGQDSPAALPEADAKKAQSQLYIAPLSNYATTGAKIELVGKDTADYKIKYSNPAGAKTTYYINMKTYLIDKLETTASMQGQEADVTMSFSDYRKIDNGLMCPFKMEQVLPQYSLSISVTKVDVNPTVDPAIFEMPK